VGGDAVDHAHGREERSEDDEELELDLHQSRSSW
jgi:hypothetical protein